MNIDEFRQNQPSIKEFTVKQSEFIDFIYRKLPGQPDSIIHDAFGFSDGEKIYIAQDHSFFTLFRAGLGFEFLGFDTEALRRRMSRSRLDPRTQNLLDISRRGFPAFLGIPEKKNTLKGWRLLDLQTGTVY